MQNLKALINTLVINDFASWFEQIAELLFTRYKIGTSSAEYRFFGMFQRDIPKFR